MATTLCVSADDGTTNSLTLFPTDNESRPVLLFHPAMGVEAGYYISLGPALTARGLQLATADLRGHGASSVRPKRSVDFGYHTMLDVDWPANIASLRNALPNAPLFLGGHSLGGQLSLLYSAANPGAVRGVANVAAGSVYWRSYPKTGRTRVRVGTRFAAMLARFWGVFPGDRIGFAGREARGVMGDWAHQARTGMFELAGTDVDYEVALSSMATPCLLVALPGDDMAPLSTVQHLASKMPESMVRVCQPPAESFATLGNPHFHWAKTPRAIQTVANELARWVDSI